MSLADVWYALFVAIIAAYVILDGFDLGVGELHLYAARTDEERRVVLNSIGPVWDGGDQRTGTEAEDNADEPLVPPPGDAQHGADEQGRRRKRSPAQCLPHRWSFPGTAWS